MREILFRGKLLESPLWIYGDLRQWPNGKTGICANELGKTLPVDPSTVGQYTGLKDKNGERIWEGDILLHDRAIRHSEKKTSREKQIRVVWFNRCGWEGKLIGGESCSWSLDALWDGDTFEIIGNVHDNPELLEEKGGASE